MTEHTANLIVTTPGARTQNVAGPQDPELPHSVCPLEHSPCCRRPPDAGHGALRPELTSVSLPLPTLGRPSSDPRQCGRGDPESGQGGPGGTRELPGP